MFSSSRSKWAREIRLIRVRKWTMKSWCSWRNREIRYVTPFLRGIAVTCELLLTQDNNNYLLFVYFSAKFPDTVFTLLSGTPFISPVLIWCRLYLQYQIIKVQPLEEPGQNQTVYLRGQIIQPRPRRVSDNSISAETADL